MDPGQKKPMLILALDPATHTGYAMGEVGAKRPISNTVRVNHKGDPLLEAAINIRELLEGLSDGVRFDLIVYEKPLPAGVMGRGIEKGGKRIPQSEAAVKLPTILETAIYTFCRDHEIKCVAVAQDTVRKHFIDDGGKRGNTRQTTKQNVFERAKLLGYFLPVEVPTAIDSPLYDRADAVAMWDWACANHGRSPPKELHMFGERAR